MTGGWKPWQRLLPVWLPVILLAVVNLVLYGWLTSESLGRAAQVEGRVRELEASLAHLQRVERLAAAEQQDVEALERQLRGLLHQVFASLDDRLTAILAAIDGAVRDAGLRPGTYSYSWTDEKDLDLVRLEIAFSVVGEYAQLRRMLASLQESSQFLAVSRLTLAGESQATTRDLRIGVSIGTYVDRTERHRLLALGPEGQPLELDGTGPAPPAAPGEAAAGETPATSSEEGVHGLE